GSPNYWTRPGSSSPHTWCSSPAKGRRGRSPASWSADRSFPGLEIKAKDGLKPFLAAPAEIRPVERVPLGDPDKGVIQWRPTPRAVAAEPVDAVSARGALRTTAAGAAPTPPPGVTAVHPSACSTSYHGRLRRGPAGRAGTPRSDRPRPDAAAPCPARCDRCS